MNFKDRLGTATFSLTDRESKKRYTIKLQSNFMNLKRFEAATGTDNPVIYAALNANTSTAPIEILYNFMIDFYDAENPAVSLVAHMDRDNIMGWLKSAEDLNADTLAELQKAISLIMGVEYESLLASIEQQSKKKDDTKPDSNQEVTQPTPA
jgi:hypothetical protein